MLLHMTVLFSIEGQLVSYAPLRTEAYAYYLSRVSLRQNVLSPYTATVGRGQGHVTARDGACISRGRGVG